jgi:DNA-binding transcriptional ArsR family regulator
MKRDVFQALADPTRRAILLLLATQAMTPNTLADQFDTSRQAVSRHIKILNECHMLKQKKAGREIYYQLNPAKIEELDNWVSQFRKLWGNRFSQLDKLLINQKNQ